MGTSASCIQVIRSRSSRIRGWRQSLKVRNSDPVRRLPEFSDIANEGSDVALTHFAKVGHRTFFLVQMRVYKTLNRQLSPVSAFMTMDYVDVVSFYQRSFHGVNLISSLDHRET